MDIKCIFEKKPSIVQYFLKISKLGKYPNDKEVLYVK